MTLLKLIIAELKVGIALVFLKKFLVHPRSIMAAGEFKLIFSKICTLHALYYVKSIQHYILDQSHGNALLEEVA